MTEETQRQWAKWIVHRGSAGLPNYACAECAPYSHILVAGLQCTYHEAVAYLAAPTVQAPVQTAAEWVDDAIEGVEILDQLIGSIERHGNYSQDTTIGFLNQVLQCFRSVRALAGQQVAQGEKGGDDA